MLGVSVLSISATAAAATTPPIVRVYVAGSEEAVSGSRDAIQDRCARANVAVVVRDAAGADEALLAQSPAPGLAQAYVDLRSGSAPRVVVVDGETGQDLERRSLPEDASLEISIETAAQVVCAAVESSLAMRAAVAPPLAVTLPAPAPAPYEPKESTKDATRTPLKRGSEWRSQLNLFAAGADFGAGFRVGAGASLSATRGKGALRWGALLGVDGYPAADVEGAGAVASFGLVGVRVLPTLEWQATPALTAFIGLGGGADWIRITAERPPQGAVGQTAGSSVDAIASGLFGVRLHLGGGLAALLALDADADLSRHRYVIATPAGNRAFFEPALVRPVALAGLAFSLAGADGAHQEARQ